MRGRFIVFEGIDGCGKTTQVDQLVAALEKQGRSVMRLREPGGTPLGDAVRGLLLERRGFAMSAWTEVFLFMASRSQLVAEKLLPALEEGRTIVLDRYYYSTAAYQGAAGKVGVPVVIEIAENIAHFPKPDLVLLLDIDPQVALKRLGGARDRVEDKGTAYQKKVRAAFLDIAASDKKRFRVIDASQQRERVHAQILDEVKRAI